MSKEIAIQSDGENIGAVDALNFISGTNVILTTTVDPDNRRINIEIESAGGGASGLNTLTATNTSTFLSEENTIVTTISSALITSANFKTLTVIPIETPATSLDDFLLNGVSFNIENIVDGVSFDIRASAINNATGVYSYKYIITYS